MTDLLAARSQMAMSLAFHILFAVAGMAMPVLMVIAEIMYRRSKNEVYLELAKRWAKGTAVLFAVGAVSGTVLSFELGLLWPTFMRFAGPIIGMPFSLEGFAFFLEAIFLGIYLYGRTFVSAKIHLFSSIVVALSGLMSGVFVVSVNSWMNTPSGFTLTNNTFSQINLQDAFFNPAFPTQALHMSLAAYASVGVAVAGIHAYCLLRSPKSAFHLAAFKIALALTMVSIPLQIISGDLAAKHLAKHQPVKLAAIEGLFETTKGAPLAILGIPDAKQEKLRYAIEIPYALSVLAKTDPQGEILGLKAFSKDLWPPLIIVHVAFQIMVGCGMILLFLVICSGVVWKKNKFTSPNFLKMCIACSPLGLIALEAGWVVTEVGRQPWIIHGIMRTKDAVTPAQHLWFTFSLFTLLYIFLGVVVIIILKNTILTTDKT